MPRLPISVASLVTELGLRKLWLMGLVALRHEGASESRERTAPPVLPGDSQPLDHQGSPKFSSRSFVVLGLLLLFSSRLQFYFPLSVLLNIFLGLY